MKGLIVLVLLLGVSDLMAQRRRLGGPEEPPLLELGQRVRIWTWEPLLTAPHLLIAPRPAFRTGDVHIVGELLLYDPMDSVEVRPAGPFGRFSITPDATVQWRDINQIDIANGRDVLRGAVGGVGSAFFLAGLYGLLLRAAGCQESEPKDCGSVWKRTVRLLPVTVPLGTLMGFFSTRWKRVY